ncbi:MAG: UDP-N-acetylmuramate--L-alanine ligase [Bacillota bacterium]|nr:UDP-N-acetylmuramate--L-alanine ligase [Bacillota bacterium]
MFEIDLKKPAHVHFIGIGGISMSGLAEILLDEKFCVTGSDSHRSPITEHLESLGAKIAYPQAAENITEGIDVVVYTAAIHPENPEFAEAKKRGIPMLTRAQLLGQIMKHYRNAISVAGTHGKTTTTSMITEIFMEAETDPTVSVGGMLDSIGGNIRVGGPDYFVMEACEYTNSFLSFFPTLAVILNIQEDHLDFFKDLADIRHSFRRFVGNVAEGGTVVINGEIENWSEIIGDAKVKVITFGHDRSFDYSAGDISYDEFGRASFDLYVKGEKKERIRLGVAGEHNVLNALAAIAAAQNYAIPMSAVTKALERFSGTHRRFEKKGVLDGVTIIDDYAHHPQEIEATLRAAKNYPHGTVWCAFQPHTYSRTAAFLDDFAKALSLADRVILADIYAARETNTYGVSSDDIVQRLKKMGKEAWYLPTFPEIESFVRENCRPGDILITMGAGDIVKVGEDLLK